MFRGISQISVDVKGRVAIPARHRDALREPAEGQVVLTVDPDGCLLLYALPEWERIERALMSKPNMNPRVRKLQRLFVGHATEVELDGQGRLLLPPPLREYAGIDRRVALIGQGNKFEIWDEDRWNDRRAEWLAAEGDWDDALDALSL
ncbi:MAG: division/cell wall cluster transcriptional repressor MraZ [Thioalkalivibrionaceae bacterium]